MLNKEFLNELFKTTFKNRNVLEICRAHLEFHYLPTEEYKELWKYVKNTYIGSGRVPTFGLASQFFKDNANIIELIGKIKQASSPNEEDILKELEEYIKDVIYVDFGNKYGDLWNKGKKAEAKKLLDSTAVKLTDFSLNRGTENFTKVYQGFGSRHQQRKNNKKEKLICYFGIQDLDDMVNGLEETDMALFSAQSGVGKTKLLQYIGVYNSRLGYDVMHLQLEGSKEEAEDGYDACWSGQKIYTISKGYLDETEFNELQNFLDIHLANVKGEVYLYAPEKFGSVTAADLRAYIVDYIKIHGKAPDLVLIDYFELMDPGNGKTYGTGTEGEKARRRDLARLLKNIAVEFRTRFIIPTQASSVDSDLLNDPNFVMTRYHLSGDKSQLDAFTVFASLNQTKDEYYEGIMRIHVDKSRKHKKSDPVRIWQDYEHNKFYDHHKTLEKQGKLFSNPKDIANSLKSVEDNDDNY